MGHMKTVVCWRSGLQLSYHVMPPAKASLATLELPRIEGTLTVKMVSERRVLRPKATLDTPEYSASVWLSRDAPHERVSNILGAFEDMREEDLTDEFKAVLLEAGTYAEIEPAYLRIDPIATCMCCLAQVLQRRQLDCMLVVLLRR